MSNARNGVAEIRSSTGSIGVLTSGTSTSDTIHHASSGRATRPRKAQATPIEDAVYAYVRALRALGRTTVSTSEIAQALSVPPSHVEAALGNLIARGVKVI